MYRKGKVGVGTEKVIKSLSRILKILLKVFHCINCEAAKSKLVIVNLNS